MTGGGESANYLCFAASCAAILANNRFSALESEILMGGIVIVESFF
jgi:hypothetical protein